MVGGAGAAAATTRRAGGCVKARFLIEENVGVLRHNLRLGQLFGVNIVEPVPLSVRGILAVGSVVAS